MASPLVFETGLPWTCKRVNRTKYYTTLFSEGGVQLAAPMYSQTPHFLGKDDLRRPVARRMKMPFGSIMSP